MIVSIRKGACFALLMALSSTGGHAAQQLTVIANDGGVIGPLDGAGYVIANLGGQLVDISLYSGGLAEYPYGTQAVYTSGDCSGEAYYYSSGLVSSSSTIKGVLYYGSGTAVKMSIKSTKAVAYNSGKVTCQKISGDNNQYVAPQKSYNFEKKYPPPYVVQNR